MKGAGLGGEFRGGFWGRELWGILAVIWEQGVVSGCRAGRLCELLCGSSGLRWVFTVLVICSICRLPPGTQQAGQPFGFAAPAV